MKVGIFSTFIEPEALTLVRSIQKAINEGQVPNAEIAFIFSNREFGESPITDNILGTLSSEKIPLRMFSALRFAPEIRRQGKKKERQGDAKLIWKWRNNYGEEVLKRLPQTDFDLLLGDMFLWGESLCRQRNGVNLHPALPDGPKGEWYQVVWELIQKRAKESGVMMHKVTPDLDRGPVIAYCRFSLEGHPFDTFWHQLSENPDKLDFLIREGLSQKEKPQYPLAQRIREYGFRREIPLIVETTKALNEGRIQFKEGRIIDNYGESIEGGYDLTPVVEKRVGLLLEGQFRPGKEIR